jgi:hypothetical protein
MMRSAAGVVLATTDHRLASYQWRKHGRGLYHAADIEWFGNSQHSRERRTLAASVIMVSELLGNDR